MHHIREHPVKSEGLELCSRIIRRNAVKSLKFLHYHKDTSDTSICTTPSSVANNNQMKRKIKTRKSDHTKDERQVTTIAAVF